MRALLIFSMLLSSCCMAQIAIPNKTPYLAMDLCYPEGIAKPSSTFGMNQSFNVTGTAACQSGKAKFYYTFVNQYNYLVANTVFGLGFSGSYSYKLYGPFSDFATGAGLVNSNSAPVYTAGTASGQYTHTGIIGIGDVFILEVIVNSCQGELTIVGGPYKRGCGGVVISPCEDCLPPFTPGAKDFVVSAWVSEGAKPNTKTTFTLPQIQVKVVSTGNTYDFHPSGQIIDGWQRIEGVFPGASDGNISLKFMGGSETTYFDDVRVFPNDGSMMSYVYDPVTMRLVAELDERNYAKFYEYDEEGKLVRVKKETAAGIMTIQENRENSSLKSPEPQ